MTPEREAQMREMFEAHWVESVQKRSSIFTRAHMTRWHDTGKYMAPGAEEGWQQWLACARAIEPMVRKSLAKLKQPDYCGESEYSGGFRDGWNAAINEAMSAALEDGNATE